MVFLNGAFINKDKAFVPVMDRGFLFGDGIYEVIPVYSKRLFHLRKHLKRLQKSLDSVQITNPYSVEKWDSILTKLIDFSSPKNQSLYLQITRGADVKRQHSFEKLTPSVYIESNPLITKSKSDLQQGFHAISFEDIRWGRCDIKSTSLLANVLYAQLGKQHQVEEVILFRNNVITECATSNVFILKNRQLFTHPTGHHILCGITRDFVLSSAKICGLEVLETPVSLQSAYQADGIWISSSTREIMPITKLDDQLINQGVIDPAWECVYEQYQQLKK